LDLVILMLGTNDAKTRFERDAHDIAAGMRRLVSTVKSSQSIMGYTAPSVLVVSPPAIASSVVNGRFVEMFACGSLLTAALPDLYRAIAREFSADFLDANDIISTDGIDGVHYTPDVRNGRRDLDSRQISTLNARAITVRYRLLGRTGVRVSEYMLGTMSYGSDGNTDEGECIRIVHSALDRGINFIDTADTYSHGQAEQIVGKAIAGRRDRIVLATKFRLPAGDGQNEPGGSRYCDVGAVRSLLGQFAHLLLDELVAPPAQRSAILRLVKKRR
jgi:hypothetical protein